MFLFRRCACINFVTFFPLPLSIYTLHCYIYTLSIYTLTRLSGGNAGSGTGFRRVSRRHLGDGRRSDLVASLLRHDHLSRSGLTVLHGRSRRNHSIRHGKSQEVSLWFLESLWLLAAISEACPVLSFRP